MAAIEEGLTLVVRHLPSELTTAEQEDLLKHFGASSVRTMGNRGRMKHIAFATFPDSELAKAALGKLHQLEILGTRLVVEFSNSHLGKFHPTQSDNYPKVKNSGKDEAAAKKSNKPVVRKEEIDMKKVSENVNSFSREWGIQYPIDPRLEYIYPVPSVTILTNIANALASVPRFYVQVLHLMNKMNLPAPFGPITQTPVLPEGEPVATRPGRPAVVVEKDSTDMLRNNIESGNFNNLRENTSEESEIESDGETEIPDARPRLPVKRPKKSADKPRKRLKLVQVIPQVSKPKTAMPKPSEMFEQPDAQGPKKIAFHLPRLEKGAGAAPSNDKQEESKQEELPVISAAVETIPMVPLPGAPPLPPSDIETAVPPSSNGQDTVVGSVVTQTDSNTKEVDINEGLAPCQPPLPPALPVVVEGGFGKIEPVSKESETEESSEEEENWGKSEFISSSELRKGRISSSEMRELSVFRKYDRGEPSTRLYIKNIAKTVTEKDLHYVYGRYVDWDKEEHCNMFDIRLMKEGRMKGQAFITLPSIKQAKAACKDTNGYSLQHKPVVVQFARSAKAKPEEKNDKKGK